jgi:hypothetical protein
MYSVAGYWVGHSPAVTHEKNIAGNEFLKTTESTEDTEKSCTALCSLCTLWLKNFAAISYSKKN